MTLLALRTVRWIDRAVRGYLPGHRRIRGRLSLAHEDPTEFPQNPGANLSTGSARSDVDIAGGGRERYTAIENIEAFSPIEEDLISVKLGSMRSELS